MNGSIGTCRIDLHVKVTRVYKILRVYAIEDEYWVDVLVDRRYPFDTELKFPDYSRGNALDYNLHYVNNIDGHYFFYEQLTCKNS